MQRISISRRYFPVLVLGALAIGVSLVLGWQTGWIASLFPASDVPSFVLKDREGRTFSSDSLRGRPALVHFWASWCAPCLQELPAWLKKVQESEDTPLQFVAVSLDAKWSDADAVLSKSSIPSGLVLLIDPEQKASESFGSFQFPETYLVGTNGNVIRKWVGSQNWGAIDLNRALVEAAGSSP